MRLSRPANTCCIAFMLGLACFGVSPLVAATATEDVASPWREDIRHMAAEMQSVHKDLFHTISRERFLSRIDALIEQLPRLQRHEIIVEMAAIAAEVGDGHTNLSLHRDPKVGFHSLPVRFYRFDDGLHIRSARPEFRHLAGAKVIAFGDVPVEAAVERVSRTIARDNAFGVKALAPIFLGMPEVLHALRLSESTTAVALTLAKDGRTFSAILPSDPPADPYPSDTDVSLEPVDSWVDARSGEPPAWLAAIRTEHRMLSFPDDSMLYVQLNKVGDAQSGSLADFAAAITDAVERDNPRLLVLDLRHNRGGGGHLRYALVKALVRAEDADTRLFVLIGRNTFSAAQFLTDDLDRYSDAVLVGEPTGSKPNAFGDSRKIQLPNSGLTVRASMYWWQEDQNHRSEWTAPDVAVDYRFADYVAGRDPALDAVRAYRAAPSLQDALRRAAETGGSAAVLEAFGAFTRNPANRYVDVEQPLVLAGYWLYTHKQPAHAIEVLTTAIRALPDSAVAHGVLAHVLSSTGKRDEARVVVQKALSINPDDQQARALLKQLDSAAAAK